MLKRGRARPFIFFLALFAGVLVVPSFLMALVAIKNYVATERSRLEDLAQRTSQHLAHQIDRELTGKIAMLQALATSPALDSGDFRAFDAQAQELVGLQKLHVVLQDMDSQQLVNTRLPWGAPLPAKTNMEGNQTVIETKQPHISDLAIGPAIKVLRVSVTVPVMRGGELKFLLHATILPEHFTALISRELAGKSYFASLVDRNGRIIARSTRSEEFVGKLLPGFDAVVGDFGSWSGINPQGVAVFGYYQRLPESGWLITTGIEHALLTAPLYRSLAFIAGLGIFLLLCGAALAWHVSRKMANAFRTVEAVARALPKGEVVTPPHTPIVEANHVGQALAEAAAILRQKTDELQQAKQDLEYRVVERTTELADKTSIMETTLEHVSLGLVMFDAEQRLIICNDRYRRIYGLSAEEVQQGTTLRQILHYRMAKGLYEGLNPDAYIKNLKTPVVEKSIHLQRLKDGRCIRILRGPTPAGGWVATHEDITEYQQAVEQISYLAHHDPLTGLANRTSFERYIGEALTRLRREQMLFSVFYLDLDHFKAVNDSAGHSVGDALLIGVARRLRETIGENDIVARLGGDEFAILQHCATEQKESAVILANRLLEAICKPFDIDGRHIVIESSLGIALAPRDGVEVQQLLKNVDLALYKSKSDGRNCYRFFMTDMEITARARHESENDLRKALATNQFQLYYQPVIDVRTGTICGVEALVRWLHPRRGLVLPDQFIPLAEETGLIAPLGEWVLRQACADAMTLPDNVKVAVNLSPVQFRKSNLTDVVVGALSDSGLAPERLELEVTESILLQKDRRNLFALEQLQQIGVAIVLDDFGTGYSSLSYLQMFAFDKIKIDRSFVGDMSRRADCAAIICAITGLARSLDIATTAEGVETIEQFEMLRAAGCGEAQGYLFGRPAPLADLDLRNQSMTGQQQGTAA